MRVLIATLAGLAFVAAWIAAAAVLADRVLALPIAAQFVYFAIAGFAWVFPVRWLMLWAAHRR